MKARIIEIKNARFETLNKVFANRFPKKKFYDCTHLSLESASKKFFKGGN